MKSMSIENQNNPNTLSTLPLTEQKSVLENRFIDHFQNKGYMIHPSVPLLSGDTDPTVLLIGSSTNVLKPYLFETEIPESGIALYQPKLRQQNTKSFYTQEQIEFTSYFTGGGVLTAVDQADQATDDIMEFVEKGIEIPRSRLVARISSEDHDLHEIWEDKGVHIELDTLEEDYYRWQFGHDRLKGRGMMLAVDNNGSIDEFSSIVIIEKDGMPYAYEWGYGTETALKQKYNLRHPICATTMVDIMPEVIEDDSYTKLADAILASAAFIDIGVPPGSKGSQFKGVNTVFVRYLQAVHVLSREMGISYNQVDLYLLKTLQSEFPSFNPEVLEVTQQFLERFRDTNDRFANVMQRFANGERDAIFELKNVKFELEKKGEVDLMRLIQEYRYQQFTDSNLARMLQEKGLLVDGTLIID